MEEVTFVSSVAQTLDGFCYTISVYRKTGGFFAFWSAANVEIKTHHQFRPRTEMLQSGNARN